MNVSQIPDQADENQQQGEHNVRPVPGNRGYSVLLAKSSEYKEGEAAFCRGLTTRDNPYRFRSPEYWRWQEGLLGNGRPREWEVKPKVRSNRLAEFGSHPEDPLPPDAADRLAASCLPVKLL